MALALATPTGPVTRLPSGIIVVRCKDYLGTSAGASVVSDSLSVAGSVVKEEQTIAVQTAYFSAFSLWSGVDPSVLIPIADLPLESVADYEVFVGCRTEGDPPANAVANANQHVYRGNGATVNVAVGDDVNDYWDSPTDLARKQVANYMLYDVGSWFETGGPTELQIRAWGVAGGDVAVFLDLVYLVPWDEESGPAINTQTDGGSLPMQFQVNGVVDPDDDDDTSSAPWLGAHSALQWAMPYAPDFPVVDVQEADDETTTPIFDYTTLYTWLAYVVGATHLPAHAILSDDMSETTALPSGFGIWQHICDNYVATATGAFSGLYVISFGVQRNSWFLEGDGVATCYIPASQTDVNYAPLYYGGQNRRLYDIENGDSTSDPSTAHQLMDLANAIFEAKFSADTAQLWWAGVGLHNMEVDGAGARQTIGAVVEVDAAGDATISLRFMNGGFHGDIYTMDAPASAASGIGAGGSYIRVKAERRGYHWRAKAWKDGDSEPGWMVDGYEPLVARNIGGSVITFVDYPYDANWSGADDDEVQYDPRGGPNADFIEYPSEAAIWAGDGTGLARMKVLCDSFTVDYDPGSGTPGDVTTRTLKKDGASLDSAVVVPYGAHQFATGPKVVRTFGSDGFDIRAWKTLGFPDLSPAIVGYVWQRETTPPLWGDIKHP